MIHKRTPKWFVNNFKLMLVSWDKKGKKKEIYFISINEVLHISLILLVYKWAELLDCLSAFHMNYTNVVKSHNTSCTIM